MQTRIHLSILGATSSQSSDTIGEVSPAIITQISSGPEMRIIPGGPGKVRRSAPEACTSLDDRFRGLVREWKDATGPNSSVQKMVLHPAYLQIIGLGAPAVPLLIRELEREPDHWLVALFAISGEDPAKGCETFGEAVDAWLQWGRARGYTG